jgi:hypothetical protein
MPKVFQLFTDLKEAKQFCYNHNMKDVDGASFQDGDLNLQTLYVYE